MKIYNTLSRKKEDFVPVDENEVKIYVCGGSGGCRHGACQAIRKEIICLAAFGEMSGRQK
jgi:hypothetical protein